MKQLTVLSVADLNLGDTITLVNPAGQPLKGKVTELSSHSIQITFANGCSYLVMGAIHDGSFTFQFPALSEK